MYHLAYVSAAKKEHFPDELDALLEKARKKNAQLGITGLLVFRDGHFIQILEGEQQAVQELFESIRKDDRHDNVTLIDGEPLKTRQFSDWSMDFRQTTGSELFSEAELASDQTGYLKIVQSFADRFR